MYEKPEEKYKLRWASSLFEWAKIWIDSSQLCIFVYSQDKRILLYYKGRSPSNGELSDFSFYIDSQKFAHRKFKK